MRLGLADGAARGVQAADGVAASDAEVGLGVGEVLRRRQEGVHFLCDGGRYYFTDFNAGLKKPRPLSFDFDFQNARFVFNMLATESCPQALLSAHAHKADDSSRVHVNKSSQHL